MFQVQSIKRIFLSDVNKLRQILWLFLLPPQTLEPNDICVKGSGFPFELGGTFRAPRVVPRLYNRSLLNS